MKRVQEAEIFIIIKNRGGRSENYFIEERMRRGRPGGTHEGGGSHCATQPEGNDIILERQASGIGWATKEEGEGKKWDKGKGNVASDVLQKHLTFIGFSCVQLRRSSKGHQSSLSLSLQQECLSAGSNLFSSGPQTAFSIY